MTYCLDRRDAGKQLAVALARWRGQPATLVLGLPRGGVPVAFEISEALGLPLDIMLVRKLGAPLDPELAIGAIAEGNITVMNTDIVRQFQLSQVWIDEAAAREGAELQRRARLYRGTKPAPDLHGRTAILVDDGCATGANMRAAIEASRRMGAVHVVAAAPVASRQAKAFLRDLADETIILSTPEPFLGIGHFYIDFDQTTDAQVRDLLSRSHHAAPTET